MADMDRVLTIVLCLALAACASAPASTATSHSTGRPHERAASHALQLVGTPYRYGGTSPKTGFDCSGLVQYSYRHAGVEVPRSTEAQRRAAEPIRRADLRPGDLLFFDQEGKKNSHVAIYVGNGQMVHAPSSGNSVRRDALDSPYWKQHLSEIRRIRR
jgi:murein DD-endopeptidase